MAPKIKLKQMIAAGLLAILGVSGQARFGMSQVGGPQAPGLGARQLPVSASETPVSSLAAQNPFYGAVPSGTVTPEELPLSLTDAIERGLKNNLGKLLSAQANRTALGEELQARSGLMPSISAYVEEKEQQINLAAFGFPGLPGIGEIIGPFGIFDSRVLLSQPVIDLQALGIARAGSETRKAANYSYENARDIVVMVVADFYLEAIAGASRIEAAQAQLHTAQALYDQAVNFKQAGVIPAIEVLRAQVELQARKQQVIFFQNEFEKEKLSLARAIGVPVRQTLRLTDHVPYAPLAAITMDEALARAYRARSDYQGALASLRASEYAKKAAEGERLPTLSVDGDYGILGRRPNESHGTFSAAASLRIPIFEGGRIQGKILEADAALQRQKAQLEDLRSRIEYEVQLAFLDLKASGDRVEVARSALQLAQQQMEQAQDRFAAGVTGNIEVVQAQEALATANENFIAGSHDYNLAKTMLARALGGAEKSFREFLLGETQ